MRSQSFVWHATFAPTRFNHARTRDSRVSQSVRQRAVLFSLWPVTRWHCCGTHTFARAGCAVIGRQLSPPEINSWQTGCLDNTEKFSSRGRQWLRHVSFLLHRSFFPTNEWFSRMNRIHLLFDEALHEIVCRYNSKIVWKKHFHQILFFIFFFEFWVLKYILYKV